MHRVAPLLAFLLILSACGGGSGTTPTVAPNGPPSTDPATSAAPPPLDLGFTDPACDGLGEWIGAVAFGGATDDIYDRVDTSSGALDDPYGPWVDAALAGGAIDYEQAAELDLQTLSLCQLPVLEGALLAALHGEPDCYLDEDRQPVQESICDFGGPAQLVTPPPAIDATFCGTVQDFLRRGAGSSTGQAAIDELNSFVDAAPAVVERPVRDLVSALSSDDTDLLLRSSLELARTVAWNCDQHIAGPMVDLAEAAIAAVPPPAPTTAPGGSGGEPDGPGEVAGGSPYVELCQGIEVRFSGSSAREWGLVLDIAVSVDAPGDVINILTQLADTNVKGEEARAPLVAALQPFLDGPCQDTGLDQGSNGSPGTLPPPPDDDVPI